MVVLTKLSIANPLSVELRAGRQVEVYRSTALIGADATFNIPDGKFRSHLYDAIPAAGDWLEWGYANFIRLRSKASHASVANGVEIEYSEDGSTIAGNIFFGTALANEWIDSDWLEKQGTHFRVVYLNGGTLLTSFDLSVKVSAEVPNIEDDPHREGEGPSTLSILNELHEIIGSNKSNMWPCFEATGPLILGFAATDLVPSDEAGAVNLEDEFTPILSMRNNNLNAYFFSGTVFRHLLAGDHADYSFEGAGEEFSLGFFVLPMNTALVQALIAKYDEGVLTEFSWHINTNGTLELILFDGIDGVTGFLTATSTVTVDIHELHQYAVTVAADAVVTFYKDGELENAADAVTPTETGSYVNMDDTVATLMVGARDDGGEPQELLNGWGTQPFVTGKLLTPAEIRRQYQLYSMLIGSQSRSD